MIKRSNFLYIFLILIPAFFVFISFFKPLHLVWGDAPYYYLDAFKSILSGLPLWGGSGIDFGGRNLALWLSPIMIVYGFLGNVFGLNNDIIVRILFYFPAIILAATGSYLFARCLKLSKNIQFFTSLVYVLNTYFLLLIDGGQVGIALAYGIFPFVILTWKSFFDKKSVKSFFLLLLLTYILCLADPRILAIAFIFIVMWQFLLAVSEMSFKYIKSLIWVIVAGILLIPINLFWLLPLIRGGFTGISTAVSDLQLTSLLNSLLLFAPNWPSNLYGKVVAPYFYFVLVPVLAFSGFIFKKTDKKYYIFAFLFLFFAFIAKGTTPPLGYLYEFLISKIPFGSIFRDSTKFFMPLTLIAGMLIGNTFDKLSVLFKNMAFRVAIFGLFYLYLISLIAPAITGKLNFNLSGRAESVDYTTIATHLNADAEKFNSIWFNDKPQIAFQTQDKPALSANQLVSFRPFAAINTGEDAYNFLNNPAFVNLFKIFGVKYVVMSGDPRNIYPNETDNKNWNEENKLVSETSGLLKQNWGTQIPVYKIENSRPMVYSTPKMYLVVGPDLTPTNDIPPVIYAEDGKFNPNILEDASLDSLKIVYNGGNKVDLAMSFLQNYFKSVTSANSEWAVYTSDQYLKYKYQLLIKNYNFDDFDYGKGIAFSTKEGEKIKFYFNIPSNGNYIIAKRFGTLKKPKLAWTFESKQLKAGNFEYDISNSSGIEVLNSVAVVPQSEFEKASLLADKYLTNFGILYVPGIVSNLHNVDSFSTGKYKVTNGDHWLIVTQNFDKDWVSYPANIHLPVYSMINGFYINNNDVKIEFAGQKYADLGIKISGASLLILFGAYAVYALCLVFRKSSK